MLSRTSRRIPLTRPLRPPNILPRRKPPSPRLFTQNSQLLLLANRSPRPQLPYLSQPSHHLSRSPLQQHFARLLSTETRNKVLAQAALTAKWTLFFWVLFFGGNIAWSLINVERQERDNPTPKEWRFWTRQALRLGRSELRVKEEGKRLMIDWAVVGSHAEECLKRLEDPAYDGKGLVEVAAEDGGLLIPGVGKAGYDISAKSHEWRTCYAETLMTCALAAEHLSDMVLDPTRGRVFPRSMIDGPSNPDPRPTPKFMGGGIAPKEENCEPAFRAPETFYMRILTGQGFTTKQRLDACLAYANWLGFKNLSDSSTEMLKWAVDIAKSGLSIPSEAVLDTKTNVLKADRGAEATPNLLRATTALATHYARTGDTAAALPIFLSVLRARRSAPTIRTKQTLDDLASPDSALLEPTKQNQQSDIAAGLSIVRRLFQGPQFPPPGPTGDEPLVREGVKPTCEEAELMLYVGEILFASSEQEYGMEGVGWTRQSVKIAEANLEMERLLKEGGRSSKEESEEQKCRECLVTGVGNWGTMLNRLVAQQSVFQAREGGRSASYLEWRGWFGRGGDGTKGKTLDEVSVDMLQEELVQVERLQERIAREGMDREAEGSTGVAGSTWMG